MQEGKGAGQDAKTSRARTTSRSPSSRASDPGGLKCAARPGSRSGSVSSSSSTAEVHDGVECGSCQHCPIKGPRFQCSACKSYSLCQKCYPRRAEIHNKGHKFYVAKASATKARVQELVPSPAVKADNEASRAQPEVLGAEGASQTSGASAQAKEAEQAADKCSTPLGGVTGEEAKRRRQEAEQLLAQVMKTEAEAKRMQEMWQNLGKNYMSDWQATKANQHPEQKGKNQRKKKGNDEEKATKANQHPEQKEKNQKKQKSDAGDKARVADAAVAGQWLPKGARCSVCKHKAKEDFAGLVCRRRRPDGTDGGCRKGVCWRCMKPTPGDTLGKLRTTKAEFQGQGAKAWWMHEGCLAGDDETDYFVMMLPAPT